MNTIYAALRRSAEVSVGQFFAPPDIVDALGVPSVITPVCSNKTLCNSLNTGMVTSRDKHVHVPSILYSQMFAPPVIIRKGGYLEGEDEASASLGDVRVQYTIFKGEAGTVLAEQTLTGGNIGFKPWASPYGVWDRLFEAAGGFVTLDEMTAMAIAPGLDGVGEMRRQQRRP